MDNKISDKELATYIKEHKEELLKRYLRGSSGESEQPSSVNSEYNKSLHSALNMSETQISTFWPKFNEARETNTYTIDQDNIFQILVGIRMQLSSKK